MNDAWTQLRDAIDNPTEESLRALSLALIALGVAVCVLLHYVRAPFGRVSAPNAPFAHKCTTANKLDSLLFLFLQRKFKCNHYLSVWNCCMLSSNLHIPSYLSLSRTLPYSFASSSISFQPSYTPPPSPPNPKALW